MNQKLLREAIAQYFNLDQLKTLCFDLSIEFEDLGGEGKTGKSREIIKVMKITGRLNELQEYLKTERPNVQWAKIFTPTELPLFKNQSSRVAVWNALYKTLWSKKTFLQSYKDRPPLIDRFSVEIWAEIINEPVDSRPNTPDLILQAINEYFFTCNDYEWLNCLVFILNYWNDLDHYKPELINQAVNTALKKENTGLTYLVTLEHNRFAYGELVEKEASNFNIDFSSTPSNQTSNNPPILLPQLELKLYQVATRKRAYQNEIVINQQQGYRQQYRFGLSLQNIINGSPPVEKIDIRLEFHWRDNQKSIVTTPQFIFESQADGWQVNVPNLSYEQEAILVFHSLEQHRCAYGQPLEWDNFQMLVGEKLDGHFLIGYEISSSSPHTTNQGELKIVMA